MGGGPLSPPAVKHLRFLLGRARRVDRTPYENADGVFVGRQRFEVL